MAKGNNSRRQKSRYGKVPRFKDNQYTKRKKFAVVDTTNPPVLAPDPVPAGSHLPSTSFSITDNNETMTDTPGILSATRRKLADVESDDFSSHNDFYILINTEIL